MAHSKRLTDLDLIVFSLRRASSWSLNFFFSDFSSSNIDAAETVKEFCLTALAGSSFILAVSWPTSLACDFWIAVLFIVSSTGGSDLSSVNPAAGRRDSPESFMLVIMASWWLCLVGREFSELLFVFVAVVKRLNQDWRSSPEDAQKRMVGRDTCRRSNSKPGFARKVLPLDICSSNLAAFMGGTTTLDPERGIIDNGFSWLGEWKKNTCIKYQIFNQDYHALTTDKAKGYHFSLNNHESFHPSYVIHWFRWLGKTK